MSCAKDLEALLLRSNKVREIRETKMNARSSRSHMILQVSVEVRRVLSQDQAKRSITKATLSMVDLAGSEKWCDKASNDQLKELTHINKSLSCLGKVVNMLADSSTESGAETTTYVRTYDFMQTPTSKFSSTQYQHCYRYVPYRC